MSIVKLNPGNVSDVDDAVRYGVGMHGETPFIAHAMDFAAYGREGHLQPGMVFSVES